MRNLKSMRRYGYETPQPSLLSRIAGAVKKQLADPEKREEALVTIAVCAVIVACTLAFMALLPMATGHETDHSQQVVAESRGER